jgi:hypothetical protein
MAYAYVTLVRKDVNIRDLSKAKIYQHEVEIRELAEECFKRCV